jgi:uncharacterized protein (TIGR03435 family)
MIGKALAVGVLGVGMAMGQAPPAAKDVAPAKQLAFDVISVRQNTSGLSGRSGMPNFGPTADGYRAVNSPMILLVITAYLPTTGATTFTPGQVSGLPDWANQDNFDIDAKVSEEELPEWQKPDKQPAMLRAMMQALLEERCKMVVHRDVKEVPVYSLVVGKNGPKFKPTNPDETHEGVTLPFGGILSPNQNGMTLYAAPMTSLAALLSDLGRMGTGRPIQDKTGLTGLYDMVLTRGGGIEGDRRSQQDGSAASDPGGNNFASAMAESLGLKLESTKAPVETLVIDHMEKPSAN